MSVYISKDNLQELIPPIMWILGTELRSSDLAARKAAQNAVELAAILLSLLP